MCDPGTSANVSKSLLAAQAVGAVSTAAGTFASASGSKSALKGQSQISALNAELDEDNAQAAILAGQRQEQQIMSRTTQTKASQKTAFAHNGIAIDSDPNSTVNNVLTTTDVMGEIDANTVAANAVRQAWGYRIQGTNDTNKALADKAASKAINPLMSTGTSLLGSASQVGMNYYTLKKAGGFG